MLISAVEAIPFIQSHRTVLRVQHKTGELAFMVTISQACALMAENLVLGKMRSKRQRPVSLECLQLADKVSPFRARRVAGVMQSSDKGPVPRAEDSKTSYQDSTGTWNHYYNRCAAYANGAGRLRGLET